MINLRPPWIAFGIVGAADSKNNAPYPGEDALTGRLTGPHCIRVIGADDCERGVTLVGLYWTSSGGHL